MSKYRALRTLFLSVGAVSCEHTMTNCLLPPCAAPTAVIVTVTSSVSGAKVALVLLSSNAGGPQPCDQTASVCYVIGVAGTYQLDISATGYAPQHKTVVVTGMNRACSCPIVTTEHITVALTPLT